MTICINGKIRSLNPAWVMGIINATTDSFYAGSRTPYGVDVADRARRLLDLGADCLDIGGYSSRPGADDISAEEEYSRLAMALEQVRRIDESAIISVDTFRADVARRCVEEWNVAIINDISGGTLDPDMFATAGSLGVAYVLMHMRGNPATMNSLTDYADVTAEVISDLAFKISQLRSEGVADIIVDPGFGFAKTVQQNFSLLRDLREFAILGCPILAGLSPEESLNGTTALNMAALADGASILRVHDVAEARQCVTLHNALHPSTAPCSLT